MLRGLRSADCADSTANKRTKPNLRVQQQDIRNRRFSLKVRREFQQGFLFFTRTTRSYVGWFTRTTRSFRLVLCVWRGKFQLNSYTGRNASHILRKRNETAAPSSGTHILRKRNRSCEDPSSGTCTYISPYRLKYETSASALQQIIESEEQTQTTPAKHLKSSFPRPNTPSLSHLV